MKKFLKELWRHTGYWANPHRVILAEREAKWMVYMNEVRLLAKELDVTPIRNYAEHILEKMGYDK